MAGLADLSDDELLAMQAKAAPGADRDYLIRTVYGEARGEPPEGQKAVASVILNRARQTGKPVRDIVLAPAQFTPWHDAKARDELTSLSEDSPEYRAISDNIASALDGDDPTGGADHFYAPKLADPVWAHGHEGTDIGNHRFLKLGYGEGGQVGGPKDDDLSSMSDADLLAAYKAQQGPQVAPAPTAPGDRPKPAAPPQKAPVVPMKAVGGIAESFGSGAASGTAGLGDAIMRVLPSMDFLRSGVQGANLGRAIAAQVQDRKMGTPFSIPTIAGMVNPHLPTPKTTAEKYAHSVGEMVPNALLPGGIPAKLASVLIPGLAAEGGAQAAEKLGGGEVAQQVARAVGAVAGGGVASLRRVPMPKGATLEQLKMAKDKAYAAADGAGFTFDQAGLKKLADDVAAAVEDAGGAELNEQAAKMARRIQSLADRGGLKLGQLDKVRSQVGEKVIAKGEPTVGYQIRQKLDALIDSVDLPEMRQAREAHMRYSKAKDVADRIESADLAQTGSGTGGNANAVRQKLKPLIDPKSNQRMKNATPEEQAALRRVVKGGPLQNTMRLLSAFDPTHGRLGALLQGGAAIPTHGASLLTIPAGMAATFGERSLGKANLRYLQDLIAAGGKRPQSLIQQSDFTPVDRAALAGLTTTQAYPSAQRRERVPQPPLRTRIPASRRLAATADR